MTWMLELRLDNPQVTVGPVETVPDTPSRAHKQKRLRQHATHCLTKQTTKMKIERAPLRTWSTRGWCCRSSYLCVCPPPCEIQLVLIKRRGRDGTRDQHHCYRILRVRLISEPVAVHGSHAALSKSYRLCQEIVRQ